MYKTCWLTINRSCNFRCEWCYSQKNGYSSSSNMNFDLCKRIIDLCVEGNLKKIVLIGGEPTIYPNFFELIEYIMLKGLKPSIITNGYVFKNKDYVRKVKLSGVNSMNVSIKAYGDENYRKTIGGNYYSEVLLGLSNLLEADINPTISIVLTKENLNNIEYLLKDLVGIGISKFHFSFCKQFSTNKKDNDLFLNENNPYVLLSLLKDKINLIKKILCNSSYNFQMGFAKCLYVNDPVLKFLEEENHTSGPCQLLKRTGLIFDTDGSLIPCNYMFEIKLGYFSKDFNNFIELETYMNQSKIKSVYSKLCGLPSLKCKECEFLYKCGGGCDLNWTNYTFDELFGKVKDDANQCCKSNNSTT